jgi:betaine-homocysteine S-methyltransferase
MLIRQVAETVGCTTEASRFSEKMQNHFMYGTSERLPDHIVALGDRRLTRKGSASRRAGL